MQMGAKHADLKAGYERQSHKLNLRNHWKSLGYKELTADDIK